MLHGGLKVFLEEVCYSQSVSQYCISKNKRTTCLQHYTNNTSQFCTCIEMTGNKNANNINTITGKICVRRNSKYLRKQFKFIKTFALLTAASVLYVTVSCQNILMQISTAKYARETNPFLLLSPHTTSTAFPTPFDHCAKPTASANVFYISHTSDTQLKSRARRRKNFKNQSSLSVI